MDEPSRYGAEGEHTKVFLLKRSINGLKQSPQALI